jgi:hypothetical protein
MSRMKFILLGLLAAFAVSAVASSSASAAHNFKVEGKTVGAGEKVEVQGISKSGEFESTLGGLKVIVTCQEDDAPPATNAIEGAGVSKFEVKFKNGCLLWEVNGGKKAVITSCKVTETTVAKGEDKLVGNEGNPEDEFKGEPFGNLELEGGGCALAKKTEIKGSTKCALPEANVEAVEHEIICTGAGSSLKLGSEPAYLYSVEWVDTAKLEKWSSF